MIIVGRNASIDHYFFFFTNLRNNLKFSINDSVDALIFELDEIFLSIEPNQKS